MKQLKVSSLNCSLKPLTPVNLGENKVSLNVVLNYYLEEGHSSLQTKQAKNIWFVILKQWPCSVSPFLSIC